MMKLLFYAIGIYLIFVIHYLDSIRKKIKEGVSLLSEIKNILDHEKTKKLEDTEDLKDIKAHRFNL